MHQGFVEVSPPEDGDTRVTILSDVCELAETIVRMTGSRSDIVFKPLPENDPVRRKPDISVARERLGWEPITDLAKGLEAAVRRLGDLLRHRMGEDPAGDGDGDGQDD